MDGKLVTNPVPRDVLTLRNDPDVNVRDIKHGLPNGKVLMTEGASNLLTEFWTNYEGCRRAQEVCVVGPSGVGKSCGVKIVAAIVRQRVPDASVYYFRSTTSDQLLDNVAIELKRVRRLSKAPVFLFFDQIRKNDLAQRIAEEFAVQPGVWVVLVSSANLPYFTETRGGAQAPGGKHLIHCPFSCSRQDCQSFLQLLLSDASIVLKRFKPVPFLEFRTLEMRLPAPTDFDSICEWTNGHLLDISLLTHPRGAALSCEELLSQTCNGMAQFFEDTTTMEPRNFEFFFGLVNMFKKGETCVWNGPRDQRYILEETKCVASPLYLQAFERTLLVTTDLLAKTLQNFYDIRHRVLLSTNPSTQGFGVERECLMNSRMLLSAKECLDVLLPDKDFSRLDRTLPVTRIGFRNHDEIVATIVKAQTEYAGRDWGLHCIPLLWNQRDIDGVQVYFMHSTLYIFGTQITTKTAQQHASSVAWVRSTTAFTLFVPPPTIILSFIAKQSTTDQLTVPDELLMECSNLVVMFYPFSKLVSPTTKDFFADVDTEMDTDVCARRLRLVTSNKLKRPCRCSTGNCTDCACGKVTRKCCSDCGCDASVCVNR